MMIKAFLFIGIVLLSACSGSSRKASPVIGTWTYNHERTKEEVAKLFEGRNISERQLDRTVVHFKKHPPRLELKQDGSYDMHRLLKSKGYFSGDFVRKGDSLILNNDAGNKMWDLKYDRGKDEYSLVFILYPIVLSKD
jgi:hypothetical protein